MNGAGSIADLAARERALDPARSFIVQAPAGSGKTELLIQRYLMLLSRVEQPEEIAAITFTRKAAAEMRKRVLEALAAAAGEEPPLEAHRALTWRHARAALDRDRAQGWRLEENATRLRIQTIDALCASLTRQMPVLAAFGAPPEPVEDAAAFYREAARSTLALLEDKGKRADLIAKLLGHLDNNVAIAEDLIAGMLARRDHWLRAVLRGLDRESIEAALAAECRERIGRARALFPRSSVLPDQSDLDAWKRLASELLTREGEWRKRSKEAQGLAASERGERLRGALEALSRLPRARYPDAQWSALEAIVRILPLAVAELKLVFAAHGKADFVEIAQGALAALGEPEAPTDLLLSLDYRIHHVLVDEFQDTSFTQFGLLEKLTAGWQSGDGRTLFLVGDPMQSIYRFREAEVGLFLRARRGGIGGVALEPLTLSVNFRSQAGIVDWVNRAFEQVMPDSEDIAAGAVPYSRCEAVHPAAADAVHVHAFFNDGADGEAARVAALAFGARAAGTVAILVRNRSHLERIVPRLKKEGLRFRAIEIEPLGHRQAVQDLLALTRALAHPADRLAWLAVLRAPWCGLTLADLYALAGVDGGAQSETAAAAAAGIQQDLFSEAEARRESPAGISAGSGEGAVWDLMRDDARLCADGRARLARVREALAPAVNNRLRLSLRDRVEGAWLALGGPACVTNDADLEDAEVYLDFLERSEEAGEIADHAAFEEGLGDLYALPDLHAAPSDPQILTIHKAKGLEFDTVIVPGLGAGTGRDERRLFVWMERPAPAPDAASSPQKESRLLVAPVNPTGSDKDPIYEYIRGLDREKAGFEDGRLIYVAATRAKKHLHLLGAVGLDMKDEEAEPKSPGAGSLLAKLWPVVQAEFAEAARRAPADTGQGTGGSEAVDQELRRLPADWAPPAPPPGAVWLPPAGRARDESEVEFDWATQTARNVGSVVHRWLQRIAEEELRGWNRTRIESLRKGFHVELAALGVPAAELDPAGERIVAALVRSIEDERGRWILGPHPDARAEHRIRARVEGELRTLVVDRLWTEPDGTRWIVDYKTSTHEGADADAFLDRERERYAPQMRRYAAALGGDSKWGLYFPLLGGWRTSETDSG